MCMWSIESRGEWFAAISYHRIRYHYDDDDDDDDG